MGLPRPDADPGARRGSAGRGRAGSAIGATSLRLSKYALVLDLKYRCNWTGREPRCVRAIAFDRPSGPLAVHRYSSVADIARPRVNDVSGGVHILGVAGAGNDCVFALELLRGRILVPRPGARAGKACRKRCPTDDASDFHGRIPQFLAEMGGAAIAGKAGELRIMCPYGPWISPPLVI